MRISRNYLNLVMLCCTMKKVYKNFVIGERNVKKRKTTGTQAFTCEAEKLVYKDEAVAADPSCCCSRCFVRAL